MRAPRGRQFLIILFGIIVGTLFGLLISRWLPSVFESKVLFVILIFALLVVGLVLLIRSIRQLLDGNR